MYNMNTHGNIYANAFATVYPSPPILFGYRKFDGNEE